MKSKKVRKYSRSRNKRNQKIEWQEAPDVKRKVKVVLRKINYFSSNDIRNLHFFRSYNAKTRAIARIWGLSKIWQQALKLPPAYIIEVISEKYDSLREDRKTDIIIHEIAHIPKNFSGSLLPHIRRGKRKFSDRIINLRKIYQNRI